MDLTGMIFKIENREYRSSSIVTTYWLITGPENFGKSYPAIKCSSTGKAYKGTNGFSAPAMRELQKLKVLNYRSKDDSGSTYTLIREPGDYTIRTANIDNAIQITKAKNRIQFLEARIKGDSEELLKVRRTLEALEMYKL